jgi:hypothetical protein
LIYHHADIYITVGFFHRPESIGEIFITTGKSGETIRGFLDCIGILVSNLLQNEVSWTEVSSHLRGTVFEPIDGKDGMSIVHTIVRAVDAILSTEGINPDIPFTGQS